MREVAQRQSIGSETATDLELGHPHPDRRGSLPTRTGAFLLSKTCFDCKVTKPVADFHRRGPNGGHVARCKLCRSAQRKAWRETSPTYRDAQADHHRRWNLAGYGLTPASYAEILSAQGGKCAMCEGVCPTGRRLAIDHDHATGQVRGLLCVSCNRDLGAYERIRERAEIYLSASTVVRAFVVRDRSKEN